MKYLFPLMKIGLFLLIIFLSLSVTKPAFAAGLSSVYEICQRPNESMSLRNWTVNATICSVGIDAPIKIICGGENDKESIFIEKKECVIADQLSMKNSIQAGRLPGGLASMTSMVVGTSVSEPIMPTDLAMFFDDTVGDNMFTTETYAQDFYSLSEPTLFFKNITYDLWKFSRNIALGLTGVFLAFAALSIMFKRNISPQVTVTVSNVLPYVPLALFFIVISYPLLAVAFNLINPLNEVARSIGYEIMGTLSGDKVGFGGLEFFAILGVAIGIIFNGAWAAAFAGALSLPFIFIVITMVIMALIAMIKYIIEYVKTIITFVFLVVIFPFACAIAILPSKQGSIMFILKKTLANVLVMPIINLAMFIGFGFILSMGLALENDPLAIESGSFFLIFGLALIVPIIKFSIGFAIMWQGLKARSFLEGALGVQGSMMQALKGQEERR